MSRIRWPGLKSRIDVLVEVKGHEDDHLWRVGWIKDLPGGGQALDPGHPDVHQHHLRPQGAGRVDRFGAVGGFPDDVDVISEVEDGAQPEPDQVFVVDE
jgi:hypothetical protein